MQFPLSNLDVTGHSLHLQNPLGFASKLVIHFLHDHHMAVQVLRKKMKYKKKQKQGSKLIQRKITIRGRCWGFGAGVGARAGTKPRAMRMWWRKGDTNGAVF